MSLVRVLEGVARAVPCAMSAAEREEEAKTDIIQHQLGLIQVMREKMNSGAAERFCCATAGMAMAGE